MIDQLITSDSMDPSDNGTTYISYSYTASLFNLSSETPYSYVIKRNDTQSVVGPFNFTLPGPSANSSELNLLIFADIDNSAIGNVTINGPFQALTANQTQFDAQICLGDIAYNIFSHTGLSGEYFYNSMQNLSTIWPFMITPGNHEWQFDYSFLNFRTRQPLNEEWQNQYFSFNYGPVHFLFVNYMFWIDANSSVQAEINQWLNNDLTVYNASGRVTWPWLVVVTHYPIYCSYNIPPFGKCSSYFVQFKQWDQLWYKFKVDLVLGSHVHYWERCGPVFNNTLMPFYSPPGDTSFHYIQNPQAPVYTIDGSAGNNDWMANVSVNLQPFSINYNNSIAYSTLTVYNASTMYYAHIDSTTGNLIDFFYLQKGPLYPYPQNNNTNGNSGTWWKVAIVIAGVGVVLGLVCFALRRKSPKHEIQEDDYVGLRLKN